MVVQRIRPISIAKIAATLYALLGAAIGATVSLVAMAGGLADRPGGPLLGALFGVGAIVLFPLFYAILGFVLTLIGAALYNVAASRVGGIELEVK